MAGVGNRPEAIWVVGAIAFAIAIASASQDIAIDAYTVDVLRPEEQGVASGARYRPCIGLAMLVSGGAAISLAARFGWPAVNVLLGLVYLPLLLITKWAPEPEVKTVPPRSLREAVWEPFLGFLGKPRAIEILAFVFLYKIADQLAQSLTRPFLIDMGYNADQRGIALATISAFATVGGAAIGGAITTVIGLGHALWMFGILQIGSNVGYFLLAGLDGVNPPAMYAAAAFELGTSGLGTGAFSVLLLRITQKRFSATQYALFSSLFAVPRILAGPIAGATVVAVGWPVFYLSTMVLGIPGLLMLARFVPPGVREPAFDAEEPAPPVKRPLARITARCPRRRRRGGGWRRDARDRRAACGARRPSRDAAHLRLSGGAVDDRIPGEHRPLAAARRHPHHRGHRRIVRRCVVGREGARVLNAYRSSFERSNVRRPPRTTNDKCVRVRLAGRGTLRTVVARRNRREHSREAPSGSRTGSSSRT